MTDANNQEAIEERPGLERHILKKNRAEYDCAQMQGACMHRPTSSPQGEIYIIFNVSSQHDMSRRTA